MTEASLYMGYRPSEGRIKKEIIALLKRGKIKSLWLNIDRDTIYYEFVEEQKED